MLSLLFKPIVELSERWAANRRPKGRLIELNQRSIFIFPTLAGWAYLAVCFVLYLVATNYQNNLIHAVSFLLIALGVLAIHYTFFNLSGLCISAVKAGHCHVGELAEFKLKIYANNLRNYENVFLCWRGERDGQRIYLDKTREKNLSLYVMAKKRGYLTPQVLKLETVFPFGLLRAWSWVELDLTAIVYPKPEEGRLPTSFDDSIDGRQGKENAGDDFSGLDEYRPGSSLRHIAWKQYAQGRGLLTKNYVGQESKEIWLSWREWPELSTEDRLSVMTYWALECEHHYREYGLHLPNLSIQPATGPEHLNNILGELALFKAEGSLQ
ncbi:DUF58 domain-containing protein [Neptuniibacter sp. 1_MG-2023]|jgi:uncharacterized protein (DUF58 family)|uniref:DUF58 domain-containing protein n=1 Tax=Neptuniibacter sp. 1_MG-2023 TaxID=3062662 RepID=UPI0026E2207E|nr:DUF58 domain-containing protein [Neptuniibacter sp. 1_MG-2023]MDO6593971.1 DUF58 domain-containing protein [Neptuniibacter sp. 1_MG-2023]